MEIGMINFGMILLVTALTKETYFKLYFLPLYKITFKLKIAGAREWLGLGYLKIENLLLKVGVYLYWED